VILNYQQILDFQQNREPYLMIDHVDEVVPGKFAKGYKNLNDEWFFKVHWKDDPNMPGMLQIEGLIQLSALVILTLPGNKGKKMYLTSANDLMFKKKIVPGDKYIMTTKLNHYKRGIANFSAEGSVGDQIVNKAKFNLVLPDEIKKYSKSNT
jgi:3-hydroxyacyl-[acyl-carrier-protein] dehydratase